MMHFVLICTNKLISVVLNSIMATFPEQMSVSGSKICLENSEGKIKNQST